MNIKAVGMFLGSLLLVGGIFASGVYVGYDNRPVAEKIVSVFNKEPSVVFDSPQTDFSPFWESWNIINEKYVGDNGTTTDQEKIWGAIGGLIDSLGDPYSVFLPPEEAQIFEENIHGNFGGAGMEIGIRDGALTVIAPLKNTPAFHAGILAGDTITEIDGADTSHMSVDEAVRLIRGEVGTSVSLAVIREGKDAPLAIKIIRDVINIPVIDTEAQGEGDDIFVIKLYSFTATSPQLFREALREFVLSGKNKLIFDLRGNTGGFLEAAVDVASWFLPAGKIIVTEDYGEKRENITHRSRGYDIFNDNLRMIILVNQGSASASEIVAGALSEHDIATLVGEPTFGKGSVQELQKVTPDSSLKITVAHWKTPLGNSISKGGLKPEFEVEMTPEDREAGRDPQLDKAIELLTP